MFLRAARRAHAKSFCSNSIRTFAAASSAAETLASAKMAGVTVKPTPRLLAFLKKQTLDEAYGVQRVNAQALVEGKHALRGWKAGATNSAAQGAMQLTEPFFGPIFDCDIIDLASSPSVDVGGHRLRGVEAEWAFKLGQDMHVGGGDMPQQVTMKQLAQAIECVTPVIEVVASRLEVAGLSDADAAACARGSTVVADQAGHGQLLMGTQHTVSLQDWQKHYSADEVSVFVNGQQMATGSPSNVLGNPLVALQWVVNAIPRYYESGSVGSTAAHGGFMLSAGTVVTTGTMTGITPAAPGDAVGVQFGSLGRIAAELSNTHSAHP